MTDVATPKSASKRMLFPRSPKEDSSDSTLGHMSPLSSSPDRYSSPPPSPQWLKETPPKKLDSSGLNQSPFGPARNKKQTSDTPFNILAPSILHCVPIDGTPKEFNKGKCEKPGTIDMDLIEESPFKDSLSTGLMTPFKCLAGKENNVERTPRLNARKLIIGESPDISSLAAPLKVLNKARPISTEPSTILKPAEPVKLTALPASAFYQSSRARASLFPDSLYQSAKSWPSSSLDKKHKRSLSSESFHSYNVPATLMKSRIKRRKLGEINVGVTHRIKKFKKKKQKSVKHYPADTSQPKITPVDRILSYVDSNDPSVVGAPNDTVNLNLPGIPSISSGNQELTSNANRNIVVETKVADPVERVPTPPPDPTKKFFKTQRTLKINATATITVDKNIKLKVSNGKFSLNKPEGKLKSHNKSNSPKSNNIFEPIGEEKCKAEVVQDSVYTKVELLLQKLVESPEKNLPLENDLQSPNHHITVLASSTSSLAISEDSASQPPLSKKQKLDLHASDGKESTNMHGEGFLFEDPPNQNMESQKEENENKYFPVFYKNHGTKQLTDVSNVRSPRGTKRPWRPIGDDQYIIDAGQKKFGATQCKDCGVVYQFGDPEDEIAHQKFHNNSHCLKYSGCKNERVVAYYGTDKVLLIKPSDSKSWINRVKHVLKIVDEELGYASGLYGEDYNQVYLYVSERKIAGCVVAHPIKQAYKMLNSLVEGCDCCSEETYPAKCGVSRIWVADIYRRKKIATKLVDSIRSCFIQGYVIGKDEIAFSAPTISGKAFAESYTGTGNYLVYT